MFLSIERIFSECKLTCLWHATLLETFKNLHLLCSWLKSTVLESIQLISHFCFKSIMFTMFSQIKCLTSFSVFRKLSKYPRTKLLIETMEVRQSLIMALATLNEVMYGIQALKGNYCYFSGKFGGWSIMKATRSLKCIYYYLH